MPAVPAAAAEILALADACVQCGLCLPHCPTYGLDARETESPRGRIALMRGLAAGQLQETPTTATALDHCLACRACENVCPAQVKYGRLLRASRAQRRAGRRVALRQRALELLLPRPRLRRAGLLLLRWAWPLIPRVLRRVPRPPAVAALAVHHPAQGSCRGRVALFSGCLGQSWDAAAARAAVRILTRLGWEVTVPAAMPCCGALAAHAGGSDQAQAEALRATFGGRGYAAVLSLASGCHESLQQALADSSCGAVQEALAFIAADARLNEVIGPAPGAPADAPLQLHLPCTQRHVTGTAAASVALLRSAGCAVRTLGERGCCGAAGSHLLHEPARADALRAPLLDAAAARGATTLYSANIGCRLHLDAGALARGLDLRLRHPLELIAERLA